MLNTYYDLVIIGGGAAGLFAAANAKLNSAKAKVLVIEKSSALLSKVRISGGGRCNVTHACFDLKKLTTHYPRGHKELLGPFHQFATQDTIDWFESKGVKLKVEEDGRMFPNTNSSQTIIDCILNTCSQTGVEIFTKLKVVSISKESDHFVISFKDNQTISCKKLLLATGSYPDGLCIAKDLGHTLIAPVPSLFTFNIPTSPLKDLSGIVVNPATLTLKGTKLNQTGPLLITHFGFSGPAALKLSAFAAPLLAEKKYQYPLLIQWTQESSIQNLLEILQKNLNRTLGENPLELPKKLWKFFLNFCGLPEYKKIGELPQKKLLQLCEKLCRDEYMIDGKTTNKEEFVTCGGVDCKEVDFKSMQSKICPGLYFAGEILNIDGITGGFNFQNAWTTGFIAANHAMEKLK